MASNFNFLVPAMFMFLFASSLGCLFLVIAWAKVLMEENRGSVRNVSALYAFTASVAVEALGTGIVTALPDPIKNMVWLLVFIAALACVIGSLLLLRQNTGPETGTVKAGSITLFVIYGLGLLSMFVVRPH